MIKVPVNRRKTITGKLNFKHQNIKEEERVAVSTGAYSFLFPVTQR